MSCKDSPGCRRSTKSALFNLSLMSVMCVLLLAAPAFSAETDSRRTSRGAALSVSYRDGLLTMEANGQMLGDVLAEIKKKSGITFTMRKTLPNDTVTASFRDVPIETAIRRLVARDLDLVWFYTPSRSGRGAQVPVEVWVVGRGERAGAVVADKGAAPRSPKRDITALPSPVVALTDRDPQVRVAAAEALGEVRHRDALAPLGRALAQDGDSDVRVAAAEALGEIGSPEALPLLSAGLGDADSEVREAVVEGLGSIGGPEAERLLRRALGDKDEDVREAAAEALARLKQTRK